MAARNFLPRCTAFFNRIPIESLRILNSNAMYLGKKFLAAIFRVIVHSLLLIHFYGDSTQQLMHFYDLDVVLVTEKLSLSSNVLLLSVDMTTLDDSFSLRITGESESAGVSPHKLSCFSLQLSINIEKTYHFFHCSITIANLGLLDTELTFQCICLCGGKSYASTEEVCPW